MTLLLRYVLNKNPVCMISWLCFRCSYYFEVLSQSKIFETYFFARLMVKRIPKSRHCIWKGFPFTLPISLLMAGRSSSLQGESISTFLIYHLEKLRKFLTSKVKKICVIRLCRVSYLMLFSFCSVFTANFFTLFIWCKNVIL